MNEYSTAIPRKIKATEMALSAELRDGEVSIRHTVHGRKFHFEQEPLRRRPALVASGGQSGTDTRFSSFITTPMILSCVVPALLLDLWATLYQSVCFPAYGIPKVNRHDYIILDRSKLRYLDTVARWNCAYCGYINGLIAYVQEIAGRTEQYWCPIKHAVRLKMRHGRYAHFLAYDDAEQYRKNLEAVRHDFTDLKEGAAAGGRKPKATDVPQ